MFALIEALRKVLDDDLRIVSAFLTKEPGFEMIFSITFDDATTGIARVACNFDTDPDALEWIKRKYTSQAASLNLITKLVPSAPVARVIHTDLTTANELGGPYILIQHSHYNLSDDENDESPFYEDEDDESDDGEAPLNTPEERELLVKRLAETAASMFRVTLPRIGAVLGVDPISGQPEMGPSLSRRYSSSGSSSASSLSSTPLIAPGTVWKKDLLPADGIQQYISNEIAYHTERFHSLSAEGNHPGRMDITSDVHVPTLLRRVEQLAIDYLVPCYNLDADPSMQRVAIVYPSLGYGNAAGFSVPTCASANGEDDDTTDGMYGDEQASGLPACLAATYPTFLRRDGIFSNRYTIPSLSRKQSTPTPSSGSGTPTNMDRHRCRDEEEEEEEMEEYEDGHNQANIVVSDEEAQTLRAVFESTAAKIEPTFISALQRGEKLRQLLEFIQYGAWDQLYHWENDVREELRQMGVCGV